MSAAVEDKRAPTIPAVYSDSLMNNAKVLAKFGRNYDFGVVRPSAKTGSKYPKVSEIMQLAITNALHRRKSVAESLDEAQKQLKVVLN
mgnify:FL=1